MWQGENNQSRHVQDNQEYAIEPVLNPWEKLELNHIQAWRASNQFNNNIRQVRTFFPSILIFLIHILTSKATCNRGKGGGCQTQVRRGRRPQPFPGLQSFKALRGRRNNFLFKNSGGFTITYLPLKRTLWDWIT
jgi:hypothetical protein